MICVSKFDYSLMSYILAQYKIYLSNVIFYNLKSCLLKTCILKTMKISIAKQDNDVFHSWIELQLGDQKLATARNMIS
jgi:hypothetical protein